MPDDDDDFFADWPTSGFGDQYDHEWDFLDGGDQEEDVSGRFTGLPSWCDFGKPSLVDPKQFSQRISVPATYAVTWATTQPAYRTAIELLGEAGIEASRRFIAWDGEHWVGASGIAISLSQAMRGTAQYVRLPEQVHLYWHRGVKSPAYPTPLGVPETREATPAEKPTPADIVAADEEARFGLLELNALPIGKAVNVTVQASVKTSPVTTSAIPTIKNVDYTITTVTVSCLRKVTQFENDRIEMTAAIEKNTDPIDVAHHLRELCLKAIKP